MQTMQWDLFCRVVDNHGDIGVCWRLATDLAARGEHVRLWLDDASALCWMAPVGAVRVAVLPWPAGDAGVAPGDAVIEAFGCELPEWFVRRMAAALPAPVWINLEYLSAESFVELSHRLPSPQPSGTGAGLRKWFFYPGFTARTGGLIRERDLDARQQAFDAAAWLAAHGAAAVAGERVVSLFCYEQPSLQTLLDELAQRPTLLLACFGHAALQLRELLGPALRRGAMRAAVLPALPQRDYDHLLWASDVNFVRGEDSFVRAQWAGKPFVWQIYPQHDGAHIDKLDAFLARFLTGADVGLAADLSGFWHGWNSPMSRLPPMPPLQQWHRHCADWRTRLRAERDLTTQLLGFVAETR